MFSPMKSMARKQSENYFRQLSSMLWTMEHQGTASLVAIAEQISPLCIFDSLKMPNVQFVIMDKVVIMICWHTFVYT